MSYRGVLSVVVKTPEMHIPPWYWFRRVASRMKTGRLSWCVAAIVQTRTLLTVAPFFIIMMNVASSW